MLNGLLTKTAKYLPNLFLILTISWFSFFPLFAQTSNINDSLFTKKTAIDLYRFWSVSNENTSSALAANIVRGNKYFASKDDLFKFISYVSEIISVENNPEECAKFYFHAGRVYYDESRHHESIEAFYLAKTILEDYNLTNTSIFAQLCDRMGHVYYFYGDYRRAKEYLIKWHKHPAKSSDMLQNVYNTIGLAYSGLKEYDSAEYFYNIGIDIAKKEVNRTWIGLISGNLAVNYRAEGDFERAIELSNLDYKYSLETGNYGSAASVLLSIAEYNIQIGDYESVEANLLESKELYSMDRGDTFLPYKFYVIRSQLNNILGNHSYSLLDYQQAMTIRDSMNVLKDISRFETIEYRIYAEKREAELEFLKQQKERNTFISIGIISVIVVGLIFLLILIRQEQLKRRKDKRILEYKATLAKEQLRNAEESVRQLLRSISDKNSFINDLRGEVEKLNETNGDEKSQKEKHELLLRLQDFTLLTEDDWIGFKRMFEKLHPEFFNTLIKQHSTLTNAEIRLAALIRLNLSNPEMANTLGISPDSVRKTNLRLRKKLDMETQEELLAYIFSLK